MNDTIICPNCQFEIEVSAAISMQLREQLRKEHDAYARQRENEFAKRDEILRQQTQELQEKQGSLEQEILERVAQEQFKYGFTKCVVIEALGRLRDRWALDPVIAILRDAVIGLFSPRFPVVVLTIRTWFLLLAKQALEEALGSAGGIIGLLVERNAQRQSQGIGQGGANQLPGANAGIKVAADLAPLLTLRDHLS
jgi:hypothetical protein